MKKLDVDRNGVGFSIFPSRTLKIQVNLVRDSSGIKETYKTFGKASSLPGLVATEP